MLTILKKIPWWGWLVLVLAIFFLWQSLSGWAVSRKLYDTALDQLRVDQTRVVRTLEEIVTQREKELADLYQEMERLKQQQALARAETERLKGKIRELQNQRDTIVVPGDPDRIVDELRRRGIGSAHRLR